MARRPFQVLPFTLSELFVLLFFVLGLALAHETRRRGEAERERATQAEALAELEQAVETLGVENVRTIAAVIAPRGDSIPDDFRELVRRVEQQEGWRPEVERQLREAGQDSARVARTPTGELIRELAETNRALNERTERLAELAGLAGLEEELHAGAAGLEANGLSPAERVLAETERLDRENRELRAQLANLMRRSGGTGVDHPPCWADADGRIEYAFEATLHTGRVDLRPVWPSHRDRDARGIPGMTVAAGQWMTFAEFRRRAEPILRWSRQQEPSCRHFVRIRDRVDGGKEAFKTGLLTVEDYFYKLLVD